MDRIFGPTTVDIGGGRRGFRSKDTVAGQPGTVVRAQWLNDLQEELMLFLEACGQAPALGDQTQFRRAVRSERLSWLVAGGTATALSLSPTPTFNSLADLVGVPLNFLALSNATSATTLNVNALGALSVLWPDGTSIRQGDWTTGQIVRVVYDGSSFRFLGVVSTVAIQNGGMNYAVASNVGNNWTVNLVPAPPAIADGFRAWFHAPATPTGNVGLTINGIGGNLIGLDGIAVGSNDVIAAAPVPVIFRNGIGWQMMTPRLGQFARGSRRQVFTSSGTFTVPSGVTACLATVIGGGGGGSASGNGGSGGVAGNSGGGGGGGGFVQRLVTGLTPGGTITVTVGAGGAPGQVGVNGGNGQNGGTSSFGVHCSSTGGSGALWGENTLAAGGAGGTGTGDPMNVQGTDGGCTGPNVALGGNATMSDTHRIYNRGGIAAGGLSTMALGLSTGVAGRGFGTGGGGATGGSGVAGGAGAPGLVVVEW